MILILTYISIFVFISYKVLYKFFIRTIWADRTLSILEYHISLVEDYLTLSIIDPSKLLEDDINNEVASIRKLYSKSIIDSIGPVLLKHCILLFGDERSFASYIGIKFEKYFRNNVVPPVTELRLSPAAAVGAQSVYADELPKED